MPIYNLRSFFLILKRHSKHLQNKLELVKAKSSSQKLLLTRLNELEQIPKIFFDNDFSLTDKETFNSLITLKIFENNKNNSSSIVGDPAANKTANGIISGGAGPTASGLSLIANSSLSKNKIDQTESRKFIIDKV